MSSMERSLLRFYQAIRSETTKKTYNHNFGLFLKFAKLPYADALLQLKDKFIEEIIEDYIFNLKKRVSPNSVPTYYAPIELFLVMNDKNLNFKKIRKMFPEKVQTSGKMAYTDDDINKMLEYCPLARDKALIHFLCSTGCRVGALEGLKLKHMVDIEDCKAVKFYEGAIQEYWGFLTPESRKYFDEYIAKRQRDGERITEDSPAFRQTYSIGGQKVKPATTRVIMAFIVRLLKRANIHRVKKGNRYDKQMDHAFRKWFNEKIKTSGIANRDLAEKLMNHEIVSLDENYLNPPMPKLFEEFKKHIAALTIDDAQRKDLKIQQLEDEKTRMEKQLPVLVDEAIERVKQDLLKEGWRPLSK